MIILGSGNCGNRLATMFDESPILLSTAKQDTNNFKDYDINVFSEDGCEKKYSTGVKLWQENKVKLIEVLSKIRNEKVLLFSSLGGGSGSSSLQFISKELLKSNNKVLITAIVPAISEGIPALANATQSINSLIQIIGSVSVVLFDNQTLLKRYKNNLTNVNSTIIQRIDYIVNLLDKYTTEGFSPITIDNSELDSVVFGNGFIDISEDFVEEGTPKFHYSVLDKNTKNCFFAMYVDREIQNLNEHQNIFIEQSSKISRRVPNARFISGILRAKLKQTNSKTGIKDRAYITIASGLNIENYLRKLEKLRDTAIKKAEIFSSKSEGTSIIGKEEKNVLDI